MAQSPAHRFGQIIGEILETAIRPILATIATELGLYLDAKGERVARGTKRKVAWIDGKGNSHDLDYVVEANGTPDKFGLPKAFIEIAWRRYTKHSRNKAQEIQGAILPLAERYSDCHPFLGVVLGGVFTEGSLSQLRSHGFSVVYFPYESVVSAIGVAGINAEYDEDTSDASLLRRVKQFNKLSAKKKDEIAIQLRERHQAELEAFAVSLRLTLTRQITSVYVLALHGSPQTLADVAEAIAFIKSIDESKPIPVFARYEVGVRYSNGDEVRGQFMEKAAAIKFLQHIS